MATPPWHESPDKRISVSRARDQIADSSAGTVYIACDPTMITSIHVNKAGRTVTVSISNGINTVGNQELESDIENNEIFDVSSDAVDYFAGDNRGITMVKIDAASASGVVEYSVIQYDSSRRS